MHNSARLILATQFYPPDTSTTAVYLGQIADTLAMDNQVVVISAAPNLIRQARTGATIRPSSK